MIVGNLLFRLDSLLALVRTTGEVAQRELPDMVTSENIQALYFKVAHVRGALTKLEEALHDLHNRIEEASFCGE